MKKPVAGVGLKLAGYNAISTLFGIFSGLIISAVLGPYQRGIYQAFRTLGSIISDLTNLGIGRFLSSKFPISELNFRGIRNHLSLGIFFGISLIPLMSHLSFPFYLQLLLILSIPIGILTDIYMGILLRFNNFNKIANWGLLSMTGPSLVTLTLFYFHLLNLFTLTTAVVFFGAMSLIIGKKNIYLPTGLNSVYSQFRNIIPIYISNILRTIFMYLDQFLVLLFLNLSQLGVYSVALSVASVTSVISSSLNNLVPSISRKGKSNFVSFLIKIALGYFLLIVLGIVVSIYLLPWVITHSIGRSFLLSGNLIPFLIAGNVIQSLVQLCISYFVFQNFGKVLLIEKWFHIASIAISSAIYYFSRNIFFAASIQGLSLIPSLIYCIYVLQVRSGPLGTTFKEKEV